MYDNLSIIYFISIINSHIYFYSLPCLYLFYISIHRYNLKFKKEEQTGIEPVTLGPAIPRSTTELLFLITILQHPFFIYAIINSLSILF